MTFSPVLFYADHSPSCCHFGSNHSKNGNPAEKALSELNRERIEHLYEIPVDRVGNPELQYAPRTKWEKFKDYLLMNIE